MVLCDLDGFKQINDMYGHMAGNQVLEAFAARLKLACREYDYVSRMGGDEFVIIAPGLRQKRMWRILCDRIRPRRSQRSGSVPRHASFRPAWASPSIPKTPSMPAQLLVEADRRMYAMKKDASPAAARR